MDTKHILERIASLRQEMQELQDLNGLYWRLREPSNTSLGDHNSRRERLEQIKAELAEMLYEFKRIGTK
jgi:hypothetical protein